MKIRSIHILYVLVLVLISSHLYYPKWQNKGTEATISWDVSGYYMYLPAFFIYKDIKKCTFQDEVLQKHRPTPDFQQAFLHDPSGNYVMKYSIGQAIIYSPAFFMAHAWASVSNGYEANGFSFPYQFSVSIWSLLLAFLGLFYLRKVLLLYFEDRVVSCTLLGVVLGSNYLNYAAIDGAMTHNTLFTLYAILLYQTIQFYKNTTYKGAVKVGLLVGLCALVRPTEILSALIPVLWGVDVLNLDAIKERLSFFTKHRQKLLLAVICCLLVGAIQLGYWYSVTGSWIVYSYQDQGFSWLKPHLYQGILSYKSGWLVYSPLMVFAVLGMITLYRKHRALSFAIILFSTLFIYIAFAWDVWTYGGSLGQRAMVQAYPVLAFPLAAFFEFLYHTKKWLQWLLSLVLLLFVYANIWFTHQAHRGGLLYVGQMTQAYFWKVIGTYTPNRDDLKLLDAKDHFEGKRKGVKQLFTEADTTIVLDKDHQWSDAIELDCPNAYQWVRISADVQLTQKEWDIWKMTQLIAIFTNEKGETLSHRIIRIQRLLDDNQQRRIFMDVKVPRRDCAKLKVQLWNAESPKRITVRNLSIEGFNPR